jgi:hypothetical protein
MKVAAGRRGGQSMKWLIAAAGVLAIAAAWASAADAQPPPHGQRAGRDLTADLEKTDLQAADIRIEIPPDLSVRLVALTKDEETEKIKYVLSLKEGEKTVRALHGGLKTGSRYYVDQACKIVDIPEKLAGLTLLQTSSDHRCFIDGRYVIVATSRAPCYCFVAISEQSVLKFQQSGMPRWLEGFSLTRHRITTDDPSMKTMFAGYLVLVKEERTGRIALGPPCSAPCSRYFAFFGRPK